jgi:2-polyprenyl-3-methyl-5-hydroxy-6-metoxy-1,4-benzoquinol methylase
MQMTYEGEQQYEIFAENKPTELGMMRNHDWQTDPRRFAFTFARYKFVSKMFQNYDQVLEVGCGDAFATRLIQQTTKQVTVIDFDPTFIADIEHRQDPTWPLTAIQHNILDQPLDKQFDGIFSLDVLEHIDQTEEHKFMANICKSLKPTGTTIIGMPSLESQTYASKLSKKGHINCKTGDDLRDLMHQHFNSVFMFSMNDETLHTGFLPMSHYLLAVCCHKKA